MTPQATSRTTWTRTATAVVITAAMAGLVGGLLVLRAFPGRSARLGDGPCFARSTPAQPMPTGWPKLPSGEDLAAAQA
ncbi:hypothetical protein ACQ7B2_00030, partial [Escherichia coli]